MRQRGQALPDYFLGNDRARAPVAVDPAEAQHRPAPHVGITRRNLGQGRLRLGFRDPGIARRRRAEQQRPQRLTQRFPQPVQFGPVRAPGRSQQTGPKQPDSSPVR